MGLEPRGTSTGATSATSIQLTLPTKKPDVDGSYFTYPDGSVVYDANDIVDVLWVTGATGYSIRINCTLHATITYTSFGIVQSQAINDGTLGGYEVDGAAFRMPNVSAICIMGMLDSGGNYLAESPYFEVRDATSPSFTTWGSLPVVEYSLAALATSVDHAITSIISIKTTVTHTTTSVTSTTASLTSITVPSEPTAESSNANQILLSTLIVVTTVSVAPILSTSKPSTTANTSNTSTPYGLSAGGKAGIGIGVAITLLTLAAVILYHSGKSQNVIPRTNADIDSAAEPEGTNFQHQETTIQWPDRADSLLANYEHPAAEPVALPPELGGASFPELEAIGAGDSF